ncbi:MAG: hypothetical protein IT385_03725 [Deltaproteobacteria bacterium]|nr:hypothetical protein [Deltaproteobacteria bacterium]
MKTIILTTLLAVSPSFLATTASAAGAPADQKAPIVAIQADQPRAETVMRILPAPAWQVTFAGLPLSTWAIAPTTPAATSTMRAPEWTSPHATPGITLFSIRF